jgi:DHA1 family bicyclomycin/chloramphenicol resistance-like MFS transporter
LSVYVTTTFLMALVDTVEHLLVLRFFQAVGGGFSTVICMASVRDIYPVEELGRRFATVTMIVLVAPLIAPALGSLMLPLGWHSIFLVKGAYASILFVLYVLIVPETRAGAWTDLSAWSIFKQCARVVARRVDGRLVPLRYALSMALSASVLMTFVTTAAFVYMEYFDVSAGAFPLVFGLSVLGFMATNLFSMRRLTSGNAATFFRTGMRIQLAALVALLVVVGAGAGTLWTVVPLIVVMMSTLGLVGPAGSAQYMGYFAELAGSASSVYMTLMFSLGGLLGALVGVLHDGTLMPMLGVMAVASLAANLIALTIRRRT